MAGGYVLIERQNGPSLALRYPSLDKAEEALTDSLYVDQLCEEDCLDVWADEERPADFELVIPPPED